MTSIRRSYINNLEDLKKKQNYYLKDLYSKLSNLPDNIEELQKLLKPLLNNVYINEYGENIQSTLPFNIEKTTKGQTNIYNIKPDTPNLDTDKYIQFLKCMIKELHKNNTDFANNNGDILTAHYLDGIDETDKSEIDKIKQNYEELYKLNTYKSKHTYPIWETDLLPKSSTVIYDESEKDINNKNISTISDNDFIDVFKKRIKALEKCKIDTNATDEQKEYYSTEYISENKMLTDYYSSLSNNKDTSKQKEFISDFCNNIKWGTLDYNYHKNNNFDYEKFNTFVKDNNNEIEYLKTFLPDNCFDENNKLNEDNIKHLANNHNREFRQYIFGFGDDVIKFAEHKQFYEIYNKEFSTKNVCDPLINWTLILNFFSNRCAMSNNKITFPIRFILPLNSRNILSDDKLETVYNIKHPRKLDKIFENNSTLLFIGFLNIKYVHKYYKQFRNWILPIFHNTNTEDSTITEYISGITPKYLIINYTFDKVNIGSLIGKFNITYSELKDFIFKQKNKEIIIYDSTINENVLFIRQPPELTANEMSKLKVKLSKISYSPNQSKIEKSRSILSSQIWRPESTFVKPHQQFVGGNIEKYKIKFENKINLFLDKLSGGIFKKYISLRDSPDLLNHTNEELINNWTVLYKYLCVSSNEVILLNIKNKHYFDKYLITQYKPLHYKYYTLYETLINFNIFKNINKNDNILNIGTNLTPIEIIINNNYKINKFKCIIFEPKIQYLNEMFDYIDKFKNIYNLDIELFTSKIETLLDIDIKNINNYTLFFYSIYYIDNQFTVYNDFYNTINLFIGLLLCLKYTKIGGYFIINLGSVAYKQTADIYLILKEYFEKSNLYYPEISNLYKDTGVLGVFQNFTGISSIEYNNLLKILNKLINKYPDNLIKDFNIYDKEQREKFNITKSHDESKRETYITGFLPDNTDYSEIIDFNNSIYPAKLQFLQKVINRYNNPIDIKLPTQDQILSSILYCKKYDIPIFDKYSKNADNTITKTILSDMYGLHEPILYKFKTPFKTYISDKIVINPRISHISKSKSGSTHKSHSNTILKTIHSNKAKSNIYNKRTKNSKNDRSMGSFFRNLLDSSSSKSSKSFKSKKKTKKQSSISHKQSMFRRKNISLEESIFNSNNQLVQVGRLIDVRKDFSKANPTEIYDKLKDQLRFYKGTGKAGPHNRKVGNLDIKIQNILGDFSISQAWLKMYEMLSDCDIVPTNRKGTYKSFHFCEAPGTFINCLNNYIHTKTQYDNYEWKSQSLDIKVAQIKDKYGLIKRHRPNWDFGVDDSGDITNVENIKHYAEMTKQINPSLITSDCGLEWGNPKYYHVAYASYVAILYSLPKDATMIYKILSPIDVPLIWNLIYITYTNFKDMYFYKPVQNSQSREFYIVAKGYLGTDQKVLDKLLSLVDRFNVDSFDKESYDLFGDSYPEEFVIQVQTICERLASNYVNSIERIIYYVDNVDSLGKDYQKHIENYIEEKNEDWVKRYKPRKMDRKWIL